MTHHNPFGVSANAYYASNQEEKRKALQAAMVEKFSAAVESEGSSISLQPSMVADVADDRQPTLLDGGYILTPKQGRSNGLQGVVKKLRAALQKDLNLDPLESLMNVRLLNSPQGIWVSEKIFADSCDQVMRKADKLVSHIMHVEREDGDRSDPKEIDQTHEAEIARRLDEAVGTLSKAWSEAISQPTQSR